MVEVLVSFPGGINGIFYQDVIFLVLDYLNTVNLRNSNRIQTYLLSFFSFSFCASLSALNTLECRVGSDCLVLTKALLYESEHSQHRSFPSRRFFSSFSNAHFCLHCSHV